MNTNYLAALGAGPSFLFICNEMSYAELPYVLEIVNHTHTILSSIALIQMDQSGARIAFTTEAVLDATVHDLLTILDMAREAGFRFETIVSSAAGAYIFVSDICVTKAAVHSAGSDQGRGNRICLC